MSDSCYCSRPNCTVLCKVCGFLTTGRLKITCPRHPKTHFLMDISRCPKCLAYPFLMEEIDTNKISLKNKTLQ